jgi:hypothetical protein
LLEHLTERGQGLLERSLADLAERPPEHRFRRRTPGQGAGALDHRQGGFASGAIRGVREQPPDLGQHRLDDPAALVTFVEGKLACGQECLFQRFFELALRERLIHRALVALASTIAQPRPPGIRAALSVQGVDQRQRFFPGTGFQHFLRTAKRAPPPGARCEADVENDEQADGKNSQDQVHVAKLRRRVVPVVSGDWSVSPVVVGGRQ